ncbi:MAG: PQQ-binding-like beta-propeller repeat protein [Planctomycetes bacterium]|nr:PQQ-binding-like beta-propeller repeat protein [Planctomycetota bacterium]
MIRAIIWLTLFGFTVTAHADNWPQWRGPANRGISSESKLPLSWSATKNVRWKVALPGAGVSQPIVWGERVFVTASDGRQNDRLHVQCYHRTDGKLLWHARLFGTAPTDLYPPGGMAVPTPATDGKNIYVLFGTGELAALENATGRPVWIRSLAQEYGPFRNRWGMGTSPILAGDTLYVQVDHWSQSYLLAVDPKTGKNRWKADRPTSVNWTSPLAVKVKDRLQIVTFGTNFARGYDAVKGDELWRVDGMHFQCIPSPIVQGDTIFACSGVSTMAIKLDDRKGDLTKTHVLWTNKKANAFLPSPLLYKGLIYLPGDRSFVTCLDAKTGAAVWKERLGEQFHASPVAAGERVYIATKEGNVKVIRAGSDFELLADNAMGEQIIASPAISDGQIFVRGEKHLFGIGIRRAVGINLPARSASDGADVRWTRRLRSGLVGGIVSSRSPWEVDRLVIKQPNRHISKATDTRSATSASPGSGRVDPEPGRIR